MIEKYAMSYLNLKGIKQKDLVLNFSRSLFLKKLFDKLTSDLNTDNEKLLKINNFLQNRVIHTWWCILIEDYPGNPTVFCPVWIILNRMGQCGQVNRTFIDIMNAGGYEGRLVQLNGHVCCEIKIDNKWIFMDVDCLKKGEYISKPNNEFVNAFEIYKNLNYINILNNKLDPFSVTELIKCKKRFKHIYNSIDINDYKSWSIDECTENNVVYGQKYPISLDLPYDIKRLISLYLRILNTYILYFATKPYYYIKTATVENSDNSILYGWNYYNTNYV